MALTYATDSLIAAIKRRGSIPTTQSLFTDQQFVDIANDEMEVTIAPLLMSAAEEFFVRTVDVSVTAAAVPVEVEIPKQAIGMRLREVAWVDLINGNLRSIPRLDLDRVTSPQSIYDRGYGGFFIQGNKLILTPSNSGGTLRLYYYARPLNLCLLTAAGRVTSVDMVNNIIVVNNVPNDWVTGDTVNLVESSQPFQTRGEVRTIVGISSPSITLDDVSGISVGDYVALEGYSPVPQLPVEAHKVLAQAAAVKCLEAMGDTQGMQVGESKLQQNLAALLDVIAPRVSGEVLKVVNLNSPWKNSGRFWR